MPFQKGNKLAKKLKRPLDKGTISFRGYEGQKEGLQAIPDWQEKLRDYVDQLIADQAKEETIKTESLE
jgi:hypothetical protein